MTHKAKGNRLSVPRSRLFALERLIASLYEAGVVGHLAAEIGRLSSQLPDGEARQAGAASASALAGDALTPERRGYALDFALEWIRGLHTSCSFAAEPRTDHGGYVRFLEFALREDRKTVGSEALSLFDVARKAKMTVESVDLAAARAYDEELLFHSSLDERAYAVLLEPDIEIQEAIDDLRVQLDPEELVPMPDPPLFPADDVNTNLESAIASKRQKGFALAEEALGKGASIPAWTIRIVAGIAMRTSASRSDRWRAVAFLRAVGIEDEVREALLREWVLVVDSTLGPMDHDSGPMFHVLHDPGPALDDAYRLIADADLSSLSRLVVRDLLVAIRSRLLNHPELVADEQALAWRGFCEKCRKLDSSKGAANETTLIDSIVKAIDG